jgi:predicted kinase
MATLHFVFGKPGAGKTSFARQLAESERAVVFIEDEWLATLYERISTLDRFIECSRRARAIIAPLATRILLLGSNVVFDFAGNTCRHRAWVRSIFEAAGADHVLHVLDVSDEECRRRVRDRNAAKPPGLYYGDVADELVVQVMKLIEPPDASEGFVTSV